MRGGLRLDRRPGLRGPSSWAPPSIPHLHRLVLLLPLLSLLIAAPARAAGEDDGAGDPGSTGSGADAGATQTRVGEASDAATQTGVGEASDAATQTGTDAGRDAAGHPRIAHEAPLRRGPPPPLGVRMGEPLDAGRMRLSYTYELAKRQGLRVGDRDRTPSQVRDLGYSQTPRALERTTHMVRVAWAPHERATLVAELPIVQAELERFDPARQRFEDHTEGIGDVGFLLVVPFIRKGLESSHVHVGFDAPTGSIRRGDGQGGRLPYDLQIGNGTWDLEWGWTYRGRWSRLAWGAQARGRHPIGRNDVGYREGSRFEASSWGAVELGLGLSASLRFGWAKQNNISGRDPSLDRAFDPSNNDKKRGGTRFDLSPGLTLELPQLHHQRLALELDWPVYQDLDGPQLERDWAVRTGWQWVY